MAKKTETSRQSPDSIGDFIISDTKLGIGTTESLSTLTVRARPQLNLTGTVTTTDNSPTVTGTGTLFLSELAVGDIITGAGGSYDDTKGIVAIASNTELTVDQPYIAGATAQTAQATPSTARFDDATGAAQVSVNGHGNLGVGTTGARAQLEVFGAGAGNYYGCPTLARFHNTQSSDAWQLVLSADSGTTQPGVLFSTLADGGNQASMTISTFDGDESHGAVDMVRIDSAGFHLLTGFAVSLVYVNANYTVDPTAHHIHVDAGTAGVTITLPHLTDCLCRALCIVKTGGTGDVTIASQSGETINGATTKVVSTQYNGIQLVATGANFWAAHVMTAA